MTTQTAELIVADKPGAVGRPMDIEGLFRFAMEKGGGVETIERLMTIRRELNAEQAKSAFDAAMAEFQSECPVIVKSKMGAKNAYKYAPLDDIVSQVRSLIRKHGFSFSVTSKIDAGWLEAICLVTHSSGHARSGEFKCPVDNKNPMMSDPQRYGGAMTFAKRYAFCNAFGILTADSDEDGAGKIKPQGPSSIQPENISLKDLSAELWKALVSVRGSENNWKAANQFLWDENIISDSEQAPAFEAKRFREVINKVKGKLNV